MEYLTLGSASVASTVTIGVLTETFLATVRSYGWVLVHWGVYLFLMMLMVTLACLSPTSGGLPPSWMARLNWTNRIFSHSHINHSPVLRIVTSIYLLYLILYTFHVAILSTHSMKGWYQNLKKKTYVLKNVKKKINHIKFINVLVTVILCLILVLPTIINCYLMITFLGSKLKFTCSTFKD